MSAVDHICCIFLREHDGQCRYSIPLDCMVCVYIVRGVLVFYAGGRESVDNSRDFALKNKSPCSACEFQVKQGISNFGYQITVFFCIITQKGHLLLYNYVMEQNIRKKVSLMKN